MGEGGMGRVCPPVRLSIVMVTSLLVIRERRCLGWGRGVEEVWEKKDVWFHADVHVMMGREGKGREGGGGTTI